MIKELKYFFYLLVIFVFLFFTIKYYFSDLNKKKTFRAINNLSSNIEEYSSNLKVLSNDTDNIIEYVENNSNTEKKKFYFWNLLNND
jgi:hypothetical protein|tara:strand:- start:3846 stop:4106 length:261 start_codon:yes stop_codon:yes gene_type:complete